ncbi:MAG TPA: subclass B3 metallo-beta-lactamase [Thermoanaerobaculia bacterium]|nr:subclass B3 metallo-beta-lactamase [Thermoanaerobaculia bacterium]
MKRVLLLLAIAAMARAEMPASWTRAAEPARIVGNIYYVGTEELGSYLLVDDAGLVLLDVPLADGAPLVMQSIEKLGFDPKNIRVLLASHAHFDHIGGFAEMQKKTGAKVYLSARDAELAARGGKNDFAFGDRFAYPPVTADHIVKDGEVVRVGNIAMTAMLTPGHTQGCTTWRTSIVEDGKPLDVVFLCSVTAPGYQLVRNEKYPRIFDDYRASFAKLRALDPDVFLSNHAGFYDLMEKLAKKKEGGANPFIVRGELAKYLDNAWSELAAEEKKQRGVCGLLTRDDIRAVQGADFSSATESVRNGGNLTLEQCYYAMPVSSDSINVEVASEGPVRELWRQRMSANRRDREEEEREGKVEEKERVRGVGEEAWWVRGRAGALYVLSGERWVKISIGGSATEKEKITRAKRLAKLVLSRLSH